MTSGFLERTSLWFGNVVEWMGHNDSTPLKVLDKKCNVYLFYVYPSCACDVYVVSHLNGSPRLGSNSPGLLLCLYED